MVSFEQCQKAIAYYLEHGKNVSDTVKSLRVLSHNMLRA